MWHPWKPMQSRNKNQQDRLSEQIFLSNIIPVLFSCMYLECQKLSFKVYSRISVTLVLIHYLGITRMFAKLDSKIAVTDAPKTSYQQSSCGWITNCINSCSSFSHATTNHILYVMQQYSLICTLYFRS